MKSLEGATVLVTGASRGIGPYLAEAFSNQRANVVLTARSVEGLERVAAGLHARGRPAVWLTSDLSTREGVETLVAEVADVAPAVDVVVNNAGIAAMLPLHRTHPDEIVRELCVNLEAPLLLCRLMLPGMLGRRRGHFVNIASLAGEVPMPYEAVYCATKAGLISATKSLRMEYRGTGVGFSVLLPGVVRGAGMAESFAQRTGLRFPWYFGGCSPEHVARAAVRSVLRNHAEIIANCPPMRGVLAFQKLFPAVWPWFANRSGIVAQASMAARCNLDAAGAHTHVMISDAECASTSGADRRC